MILHRGPFPSVYYFLIEYIIQYIQGKWLKWSIWAEYGEESVTCRKWSINIVNKQNDHKFSLKTLADFCDSRIRTHLMVEIFSMSQAEEVDFIDRKVWKKNSAGSFQS